MYLKFYLWKMIPWIDNLGYTRGPSLIKKQTFLLMWKNIYESHIYEIALISFTVTPKSKIPSNHPRSSLAFSCFIAGLTGLVLFPMTLVFLQSSQSTFLCPRSGEAGISCRFTGMSTFFSECLSSLS